MLDRLFFYESTEHNPYKNIALETFLLRALPPSALIFYLWQNEKTCVIGRNQNAWKECRIAELENDGGSLARRLSGGGAVFHDLGNLCWTFITNKNDFDTERQTGSLLSALNSLNINAVFQGRNDMEIDGRKFSGAAYYTEKDAALHHGTFLVDADLQLASKYLSPPREKIESKGVESVRKRIVNLAEIKSGLTVDMLKPALKAALENEYNLKGDYLGNAFFDGARLLDLEKHFAASEWKYGHSPQCSMELSARFSWGVLNAHLDVEDGKARNITLFSDALREDIIGALPAALEGSVFVSGDEFLQRVDGLYSKLNY